MSLELSTVHQLIVGFANTNNGYKATGSVTLIQEGPLRILVDCGDPWNGGEIINKLMDLGTTCSEVTHVIITHGHLDHCGNLNLFKNAQIFMAYDFVSSEEIYSSIDKENGYAISENIKIEVMKGHTSLDLIVRVTNSPEGCYVIAGDLFESEEDEGKWQEVSEYPEDQLKSREKILASCDFIIPGHGSLFSAKK